VIVGNRPRSGDWAWPRDPKPWGAPSGPGALLAPHGRALPPPDCAPTRPSGLVLHGGPSPAPVTELAGRDEEKGGCFLRPKGGDPAALVSPVGGLGSHPDPSRVVRPAARSFLGPAHGVGGARLPRRLGLASWPSTLLAAVSTAVLLKWVCPSADAQHPPQRRNQAGDRHLKVPLGPEQPL